MYTEDAIPQLDWPVAMAGSNMTNMETSTNAIGVAIGVGIGVGVAVGAAIGIAIHKGPVRTPGH
jgi:hypothetical protein